MHLAGQSVPVSLKGRSFADGFKFWPCVQDSLGGNSKTFMIANISPCMVNYSQTLSTLRFAQRAKRVRNQVGIRHDMVCS